MGSQPVDGVEAELQRHFGIPGNAIPVEMLLETRAAATFTGDEPNNTRPIVTQVFPMSVSEFAGVNIETVPVGQASWPIITTGATVHAPAQGADAAETTGVVGIDTLNPKRLQSAFSFQVEDQAALGFLDAALRQNLSEALGSELDKKILTRTGDGLLDFGTDPTTPTAATTAAEYMAAAYAVDAGVYANSVEEIRMIVGPETYVHMGSVWRANGSDDNIASLFSRLSGGLRVSGHVPDYASNHQEGVVIKGMPRRNCVAALWQGVSLIEDRVTRAKQGEIILTAVSLYDFKILRTDGYTRHRFRTS